MATYLFETITAAQAAQYYSPVDTIVFTSSTASASRTTVTLGASSVTITDNADGHSVTFGPGMFGETDFVFPDASHLAIGGSPVLPPPPPVSPPPASSPAVSPPPVSPPPVSPPPHLGTPGAHGTISGNMDTAHLADLVGAAILTNTSTTLDIGLGGEQLHLAGSGLTYDINDQLTGGTVTAITFDDPDATGGQPGFLQATLTGLSVSAAPFDGWVLSDATQVAFSSLLAGDDTLQGGAGNDLIRSFAGDDSVTGGAGDDTLIDSAGSNYLRGEDGNDSIQGGSGFDDINGNKGEDTIDGGSGGADWLVGGQGNDLITAHAGQNILYGNLGNDTLHGGSGGDLLRGGQGDDVIVGGSGNDWISGDRGNDTITGGAGADTFHTSSGAGIDKVLDFHSAEGDRVQVDVGTSFTVSQVGADTVIDMGAGDQMILVGVQLSTLPPGWIFVL